MADRRNTEGYPDPTVYAAERSIEKSLNKEKITAEMREAEIERKAGHLIGALKYLCEMGGFEFIGRIQVRHKQSGREFR